MDKSYPYKKLDNYPHMKPLDRAVWERFIDKYPLAFDKVFYDVHVGEGAEFLPTGEDTPEGRHNRIYQKKIDVLAFSGGTGVIVELKPNADMKALGQVLTYKNLLTKLSPNAMNYRTHVISETMDGDFKDVFRQYNILIFLV